MGISVVMGSPTSLKIVYWPTPFLTRPQGLGFAVVRVSSNEKSPLHLQMATRRMNSIQVSKTQIIKSGPAPQSPNKEYYLSRPPAPARLKLGNTKR